ncbi:MAG: YceI family protein [Canibacter sp.]
MTVTADQIAGYQAATWNIDPSHTEVSFTVRHAGISKVRGTFKDFAGTIVTADNPADSSVEAVVQMASVTTNDEGRDQHLHTSDFFAVEEFPELSFKSTEVRLSGNEEGEIDGDLTLRGVTKPVTFKLELGGFATDAFDAERLGLTATTTIDRTDFGVDWNAPLEKTGGVLVSKKVQIELDLSAVLADA